MSNSDTASDIELVGYVKTNMVYGCIDCTTLFSGKPDECPSCGGTRYQEVFFSD